MHYFWPGMYQYCSKMCVCALPNATLDGSQELVYSFYVEEPFGVLHVNIYRPGNHSGFDGSRYYL